MAKLVRIVALALLTVALPLQAMASVITGLCAASGHHDQASHGDSHDGHDHSPAPVKSSCGPCVACCAVAVAGRIVAPLALAPADAPAGAALTAPPGISLDTPDRPPLVG